MTNQQFMALQGGSSTQRVMVSEIMIGGQASTSSPSIMVFSRDSIVGATLTALTTGESDTSIDASTAALAAPVGVFTQSTTKPQRSATAGLANFTFNAYGGVIRWVAAPYAEFILLGNTASLGEVSLSAYTGSTAANVGAHIIYEPL
jgi:hypothetical protein